MNIELAHELGSLVFKAKDTEQKKTVFMPNPPNPEGTLNLT